MGNDNRMSALTWGLLLLLGLIWGGSFFFARIAVHHVPPFTLVLLRLSLAALALHLYLAGRFGIYQLLRTQWRQFLLLGLINNAVPHTLIFFGQTQMGAGLASILNATTPIWTVLIGNQLTTDERLTPAKLIGCFTGLIGTAVLLGPSVTTGGSVPFWALSLPILAAISYGFAAIYAKRFKGIAPPVVAAGQLTGSSLIMLPVAVIVDQPWSLAAPPATVIAAILGLALLSTAFAYILYFRIMALAGATNASLVTLLVPPSALLLGFLFLDERLGFTEIAGMVLIGAGLLVLDGRFYAWMKHGLRTRAT
ncbi:DMT family transporter [Rhizobium sp. P40RR-XXII]|uniref:DMT family transporter n=1 Tax=unclassified Rhizobium TaxID=2613769 RepID=UPI0014577BBE|nr:MULTISPECIES: DMT family transporter [unclassified Rhizobium]NLR88028.1 DMT family transporter [Rhizobium sp. P28RR-XV]NLS19467.1 DMT family transporter [Rhizobium sp. P40RR-XXII]